MAKSLNDITLQKSLDCASPHFNLRRLAAYANTFFYANSRKLLLLLAQIFIVVFIFFIFNLYTNGMGRYAQLIISPQLFNPSIDLMWGSECDIMTFLTIIFSTIAGSMMFGAVSERNGKLNTLEVPASQLEKFTVWFVVFLPLFIVACWACFYLADIIRVLWVKSFTEYGDFAEVMSLRRIILLDNLEGLNEGGLSNGKVFGITLTFCTIVTVNALFALGSIVFSRLAYLKSAASLFLMSNIFGLILYAGTRVFFPDGNYRGNHIFTASDNTLSLILACITFLISTFIYWVAYLRFRESEIISRW